MKRWSKDQDDPARKHCVNLFNRLTEELFIKRTDSIKMHNHNYNSSCIHTIHSGLKIIENNLDLKTIPLTNAI